MRGLNKICRLTAKWFVPFIHAKKLLIHSICRPVPLLPLTDRLFLTILSICILSLHGCATYKIAQVGAPPPPLHPEETIERNDFLLAKEVDVIGRPAIIRLEEGDTLPDIARHFSLGINGISAANPGIDIWVPRPGERILLPLSFILPDAPRKGIVINLAAMRLYYFKGDGGSVSTYPIGIGTSERPSPLGQMHIERKMLRPTWYVPASIAEDHRKKGDPLPPKVPPGPLNPLGEYALYLSKSGYLIHGTNKPASIGLRATNGCIRLYPEDIKRLYESTPVKTPVHIVNQPYLIGRRDGIVYLEVHKSLDDSDTTGLEKIYAKLRSIGKKSGRALDWGKVENVVAEARGIPVPVFELREGDKNRVAETLEVKHPDVLYGKPVAPELRADAWYVLAARLRDKKDAQRLAAIINHQGPQIPARVLSTEGFHRVIAGPFNNAGEAGDAAKRLRIDLEIDGILVEPAGGK